MFKRFKDRLTEVSEEVKRDPRFVNGIQSVNQLAQQTYSVIKNEKLTAFFSKKLNIFVKNSQFPYKIADFY